MKRYLITLALVALLAVAGTVFAAPSSVDRITNRIEPLIKTDFIRAVYFVATSTTASSTFANGLNITGGCFAVNNVCITAGGGGGSGVVNPGTQGQNAFYDSTGATVSGTSTIFISTASNVGIGTTTPAQSLDVAGLTPAIQISNTNTSVSTGATYGDINFYTSDLTAQGIMARIRSKTNDQNVGGDGELTFWTYQGGTLSEKVRLTAVGRLGIGTTTPSAFTHITNTSSAASFLVEDSASVDSTPFVIDASGNVGIGTTTPTSKLSVIGSISGDSVNTTSTTATSTFLGKLQVGTYAGVPQIVGPDIDTGIHFDGPDIFSVHTGGTTRFLINSSGNVGIGTTTPSSNLDVRGSTGIYNRSSSGGRIVFDDTDVADASTPMSYITGADGSIQFGRANRAVSGLTTGSAESVRLTSVGNVGIGTTTPYAKLAVVGDVVADTVNATSTTATSTFQGNVLIGPTGRFPKGFTNGTNFVLNDTYVGPFQGVVVNDSTSNFAIASWFLGNDKYVPNEFFSTYYCGMAMASSNYNVPGFNGLKANGAAFFCKDGDITVGTGTTTGTIRLQAGGLDADQVDVVITGVNGNMGVGTTSPYAKLSIHPKATDTQTTLFAIASSTATATSTHMVVLNTGQVGIGTTSPTSGSLLDVDGIAYVGRNSGTSAQLVVEGGSGGTTMISLRRTIGANATYDWSLGGGCLSFSDGVAAATTMSLCGDAGFDEMNLGGRNRAGATTRADWIKAKSFGASAGTDVPGVTFNIQGSLGTGAGTTGNIRFLTANQGSSGTTQQTSSERMIIMGNTGNVGVGTTTPVSKFQVYGSSANAVVSIENTGNGNTSGIDFVRARLTGNGITGGSIFMNSDTSSNNALLYLQAQSAGIGSGTTGALSANNGVRQILRGNTGELSIENGNLESARYTAAGNFGLGTTSPYAKLSIHQRSLDTGTTLFAIASSTATATTTLFTISNTGNVGVGSTTPGRTLAVAGAALMTGTTTSAGVDLTSGCYAFQGECVYGYRRFSYSTTTAWTGTTTTQYPGPAYDNEVWSGGTCKSDGNVVVQVNNGSANMNPFTASSTVGKITYTSNNTVSSLANPSVVFGSVTGSPTYVTCTFKVTYSK